MFQSKIVKRLACGIGLIPLFTADVSYAMPLAFVCDLESDGEALLWDLLLNEHSKTVTRVVMRTGREDTMKANFRKDEIFFTYLIQPGQSTFGVNFRLNRWDGVLESQVQGDIATGQFGKWKRTAICQAWR